MSNYYEMKNAYQPHVWPATWFWNKNPYVVGGNIPRIRDRVTKENYDFGQLIPDLGQLTSATPEPSANGPTLRYCDKVPCRKLFGDDYPEQAVQLSATTCLCPCRTCVNSYDLTLGIESVRALKEAPNPNLGLILV